MALTDSQLGSFFIRACHHPSELLELRVTVTGR
jgi:hypothetical protein